MTVQEAIERFKALAQDERGDLCKAAVEALEKQIPKKPTDNCSPVVKWGLCPACKGELNKLRKQPNRVFDFNAYCPDCGQALDWSEEE